MDITTAIDEALATLKLEVPGGTAQALAEYLALVAKWNRAYNLTAVRDPAEMITRHVLDSATALPFLRGKRMLDAGSGAGFPGIVLALLAPESEWTLVEANGKKARFLDHSLRHLGLSGRVSVHPGRLESYHSRPGFDTVTARALASLATLAAWTTPILAPGGRLVAFKGRGEEIAAERKELEAGWQVEVTAVVVPGLAAERHILVLERNEEH